MKYPLFALSDGSAAGGTPSIDSAIDAIQSTPAAPAPAAPAPVVAPPTPAPANPTVTETPVTPETKPDTGAPDEEDSLSGLLGKPKAAPAPDAAPEKQRKPGSLAEFRENYERTKKELETERKLKEELRIALTEGSKKEIAAAKAALEKERDEIRAKYEEAETRVRHLDYTRSHDYQQKYQEPIKNAWAKASKAVAELKVNNEDGTRRDATSQDLTKILQISNGSDAREAAKAMFGEDAPDVMAMRRQILDLYESADEAVKDWKTKGDEAQERAHREAAEHNTKLETEFDGHLSSVRSKHPDIYDFDPKDAESEKYVRETERFIDIALKGKGLPEGLSPQEKSRRIAINQAEIAARARAWAPQILARRRAEAEVEKLKAEIAELRGTEPGPGGATVPAAATAAKKDGDWMSAIDALPAGRR